MSLTPEELQRFGERIFETWDGEKRVGLKFKTLFSIIAQVVGEQIRLLKDENKSLQERVAKLEERGGLKYLGVYQRAITYERGSVVTHDGSAWVKIADSKQGAPGACDSWQLLVKRGRDAK